jgi:hypothetical protein
MLLKVREWNWIGGQLDGFVLVFAVEEAPLGDLWFEVSRPLLWSLFRSDNNANLERHAGVLVGVLMERLRRLDGDGLAALVRQRGGPVGGPQYVVTLGTEDADAVNRAILGPVKECSYQRPDGSRRDLFCVAGVDQDKLAKCKAAVPTTRHLCRACQLPDGRIACIHLHHPSVFFTKGVPEFKQAACDLGSDAVAEPALCAPGGHACWEGEVESPEPQEIPASSLALHEAFDFLNASWKEAFGSSLSRCEGRPGSASWRPLARLSKISR